MENPAYWSEEVTALDKAISEASREISSGIAGISFPQNVYNKLRELGFTIKKIKDLEG